MNLDSRVVAASSLLLALCLSIFACGKTVPSTGTDSATHWLSRCSTDAECGGLDCICGTCTTACTDPSSCPQAAIARCGPTTEASCGSSESICVAECRTDADCNAVRRGLVCAGGRCSAPEMAPGGAGSSGSGGNDCSALPACRFACPDGTINPVDENGCTHSCECANPGTPAGSLTLFYTCGDP